MWTWLRRAWGGEDRGRQDLDDEMRFHIESLTQDLIDEGMEPAEARREAVRRFGSPEAVQERVRKERGFLWMDELSRNLRFAFRQIGREPVFGATYVLTTALIVALGALAWAVADTTLLRGLPYPDADRLVHVSMFDASNAAAPTALAVDGSTWEQFRDAGPDWPKAVYSGWGSGVNLSTDAGAAYVIQQRVGAGYFETLGVSLARGREFSTAEDVPQGPAVAILSHGLWSETFASDPDILGTTIRLKGEPHTVVGVMPEDFRSAAEADVWTPLRPDPRGEGGGTNYTLLARVPDGTTLSEAGNALLGVPAAFDWAQRDGDWRFGLTAMDEADARPRRAAIRILVGGIGLMMIVGLANLAGLQIARTLRRSGEFATRRALGGGGSALVRQLSTELLVSGLVGGAVGVAALLAAAPWVSSVLSSRFGTWQPFPGRGALVAVALGFTLVSIVLSGVWPVARSARRTVSSLREHGTRVRGGRHVGRKLLLIGQLAGVTVLVFAAGLLARSYAHLDGLEAGFRATDVHTATYSLDDARWAESSNARELFGTTLEALEARSEVASAAVALTLPYERPLNMPFQIPGSDENLLTNVVYVTPGFFELLEIPVLRGRGFEALDGPEEETVYVVNQAFVDRYLERSDPLGARIAFRGGLGEAPIVGMVGNVQQSAGWGNASTPVWETPTVYVSAEQVPSGFLQGIHIWFSPSWLVRGTRPGAPLAGVVTEVFRQVAPGLPQARSGTLTSVVDRAFARQRLEAGFLLVMAVFAMVLAGIGLWGLVSQEVVERKGEMGVRMALGASPGEAVKRTAVGGMQLAALGLGLGMVLSVPAARLLESLIYGVGAWDPTTLGIVVGALGLLAVVASFVPAARIGRIDPARILRSEG